MVSLKGLLYTAVGAAATAAIVGVMLTPERGAKLRNAGDKVKGFVDQAKNYLNSK